MGNICRSPTAEGVFATRAVQRGLIDRIKVDSAGTHNFHPGLPPDQRAQRHARMRGYDLSALRARQLRPDDFVLNDLILVMDWDNLSLVQEQAPAMHQHKIRRLSEFCRRTPSEVIPDPYYGGAEGFEQVLDLIEDACDGLLDHLEARMNRALSQAG
jgi:protein-tyrosine phosphatase